MITSTNIRVRSNPAMDTLTVRKQNYENGEVPDFVAFIVEKYNGKEWEDYLYQESPTFDISKLDEFTPIRIYQVDRVGVKSNPTYYVKGGAS